MSDGRRHILYAQRVITVYDFLTDAHRQRISNMIADDEDLESSNEMSLVRIPTAPRKGSERPRDINQTRSITSAMSPQKESTSRPHENSGLPRPFRVKRSLFQEGAPARPTFRAPPAPKRLKSKPISIRSEKDMKRSKCRRGLLAVFDQVHNDTEERMEEDMMDM